VVKGGWKVALHNRQKNIVSLMHKVGHLQDMVGHLQDMVCHLEDMVRHLQDMVGK
jgi:hypothetical protein